MTVVLRGLPKAWSKATVTRSVIDANHANAFSAWQKMGAPTQPTAEQLKQLEQAGQLASMGSSPPVTAQGGTATLDFVLPRQAVLLQVLQWE